jgi:hypothetical protein
MRYIKLYEGFQSESEVTEICKKYGISNWSINSEGLVDVDGDVYLDLKELTKLPLKFGEITIIDNYIKTGYFSCDSNKLTTLEGSPYTVGGDFYCSNNQLTSLEGCPKSVGRDFYCMNNQITSFEGCPKSIGGDFYCEENPLYNIWKLINTDDDKWDNQVMELFNDYDCIRGTDVILDRFNDFLEEISKSPVDKVNGYNNI